MTPNLNIQPDIKISLKQSFGIDSEMEVDAFSEKSEYVPEIDKNYKFDIRFHVEPDVKLMKTQDGKSILIELEDEGWKFTCDNYDINIDNGLYFGNKNSYIDNQNIFISGISNNQTEDIKWQIKKI